MTVAEFGARYGRALHAVIGGAICALAALERWAFGWPMAVGVALAVQGSALFVLAHEQAWSGPAANEGFWSDFKSVNGGPWNGVFDVLSALAPALLWFLWWGVCHA